MRGFYSVRPRFINAIRRPPVAYPENPYQSNPDYAERHQESVTEYPSGLLRIDLGEPIAGKVVKKPAPPAPKAEPAPEPVAAPTASPPDPRTKAHRAITRHA